MIGAEALVISFWRGLISGLVILLAVLVLQGTSPFCAVLQTGCYGIIYILAAGVSGMLFVLAVSMTSIANVVFIIATLPVFAVIYSRLFLGEPTFPAAMVFTIAAVAGPAIIAYGSGDSRGGVNRRRSSGTGSVRPVCRRTDRSSKGKACFHGACGTHRLSSARQYVCYRLLIPSPLKRTNGCSFSLHGIFIVISSALLALGPRYISSAEVGLLILPESVLAPLPAWMVIDEFPGNRATGGLVVIGALGISNAIVLLRKNPA